MASYTEVLGLVKPRPDETVNVDAQLNVNSDILEVAHIGLDARVTSNTDKVNTVTTDLVATNADLGLKTDSATTD